MDEVKNKENVWLKMVNLSIKFDYKGKPIVTIGPEIPKRKVIVEKYAVKDIDMGMPGHFSGKISVYGENGFNNSKNAKPNYLNALDSTFVWESD
jgi:hypothetical protein